MRTIACVVCALALAGCSSFINRQAASSTYRILIKSTEAAQRQVDVELARDAMPGGLLQIEAFALAYPDHDGFKTLYADSFCQYAVAFVFDDWEEASLAGRSEDAARIAARLDKLLGRCVELNLARLPAGWRTTRAKQSDQLLREATREHVPALLWLANADAVRVAIAPMQHLGKLASVEATLARCAELAPGYRDANAEILLGTLKAGRSQFFGGDDGHEQFERARKLAGDGVLLVDVMYARGVAVARKDRALFEATLARVMSTDVSRWPDHRLSNELALRKARRYLAAEAGLIPTAPD